MKSSRPKLLLVEDNQLLRWWMQRSLDREGFWALAPTNMDDALRLASNFSFDVLITDWRLWGGHSGFEILEAAQRNRPDVAVLVTTESGFDLSQQAREAGFDRVIQKPFPVAEILSAVHELAAPHHQHHGVVA